MMETSFQRTTAACVTVRSVAGLMPVFQRPFLKFIYEKPSTQKRVSARSDEAAAMRLHGTDTAVATWRDAVVCVPVVAQTVTIELWNAHAHHDIYLGRTWVHFDDKGPPEVGPTWIAVNQAAYEGVSLQLPMNLEVIVTRMDDSAVFPSSKASSSPTPQHAVVHPSFQFKIPAREIDWAHVASTNVPEIFFMGDVDALLTLKDEVLHGNSLASLDMIVDKEFERAFQMCQYSAQYLHQCVEFLSQRCATYVSSRDELLQRQQEYKHALEAKRRQRRQLEKQAKECDALIMAYEAIAKTLPATRTNESQTITPPTSSPFPASLPNMEHLSSSPPKPQPVNVLPPPTAETQPSPSKAPMLMSYEERLEKNRLAKEATRQERIAAEKHRLTQIMAEQAKQREWKQTLLLQDQALLYNAARRLQTWFSHRTFKRRYRVKCKRHAAAVVIQCRVRQIQAKRVRYQRRDEARDRNEKLAVQAAEQRIQHQLHVEAVQRQQAKELEPILRLWSDVQQAFQRASRVPTGASVFSFFDPSNAGQVDRAMFRRQLLRLGFDVPRQVVRRLIQLIHSRSNVQSDRLVVTAEQFTKAFDLTSPPVTPSVPQDPPRPVTPRPEAPSDAPAPMVVAPVTHVASATPTLDSVEGISLSFRQLRERIVHAARVQFGGGGHSTMTFASLRAALIKLFGTFDPHGNGDVSLDDFKAVVESQLHVTIESHWDYVRECFDVDGSGSLNIAEFVSFAFADSSVDEMGVLGFQLRDAILHRVKAARKEAAATIEDAVRHVFHPVFHKREEATFADFCHALAHLKLGFTLGQLSRLALRLDQDKNHLISLEELLRWLRLKTATEGSSIPPAHVSSMTTAANAGTRASVSKTSTAVKELRQHLIGLAGEAKPQAIKALFEKMDADQSAKLSASELHAYLAAPSLPLSVVESAVACMDARRSSVVSKADFIAFCLDTTSATEEETGVVMEQCRRKLAELCVDQAGLQRWFGALSQQHGKVRTTELKRALKAIMHVPEHVLEGVVRRLDFDGSGWISDQEFHAWVQPVRDIEVLLQLVEQNQAMQQKGADLFATFDLDGNGVIGLEEFHAGLKRFHVDVNTDEAAVLLKEFDLDGDGVLTASELNAIVEAYNSDDFDTAEPPAGDASYQGAAYDDDDFDDD